MSPRRAPAADGDDHSGAGIGPTQMCTGATADVSRRVERKPQLRVEPGVGPDAPHPPRTADPLAFTLARAVAQRAAGAALQLSAPTLQRQFRAYSRYRLASAAQVKAELAPAPGEMASEQPFAVTLNDDGREYFVAGFTNDEASVILYDQGQGYWLKVPSGAHGQFTPVHGKFSIPDAVAESWEGQTRNDCWFASFAVLVGKKQHPLESVLRDKWGWEDSSFYGIGSREELEQIGSMCGTPVQAVEHSAEAIRSALSQSESPLVIGVPGHAMVLYAMQEDGTASTWDPATRELQYPKWSILKDDLRFAVRKRGGRYSQVYFDYTTTVESAREAGGMVYESELDYS